MYSLDYNILIWFKFTYSIFRYHWKIMDNIWTDEELNQLVELTEGNILSLSLSILNYIYIRDIIAFIFSKILNSMNQPSFKLFFLLFLFSPFFFSNEVFFFPALFESDYVILIFHFPSLHLIFYFELKRWWNWLKNG
jgi:hypothetical protein